MRKTQIASAEYTSDGNSSDILVGGYKEGIFFLNITAASGSMIVYVKTKDTTANNYHLLDSFTPKSGTGEWKLDISEGLGEYIRLEWEISGTFTFSIGMNFK